jgi:hypothetical protein
LQLDNATPFQVSSFRHRRLDGHAVDVLIAKGTFDFPSGRLAPAEQQQPVLDAAIYEPLGNLPLDAGQRQAIAGREDWRWLRHESDRVPCKPRFDVLINAWATCPGGEPATRIDCQVLSFGRSLELQAFGPRYWASADRMTDALAVHRVPALLPFSYGGMGRKASGKLEGDERNSTGLGYVPAGASPIGLPTVWLQSPKNPVRRCTDAPAPCGLGVWPADCLPRRSHGGTFDEAWKRGRNPLLPLDFSDRYYNAAPEALQFEAAPAAGERVELINLCARGRSGFAMPTLRLAALAESGSGQRGTHALRWDTLILEPDANTAVVVWRAEINAADASTQAQRVTLTVESS